MTGHHRRRSGRPCFWLICLAAGLTTAPIVFPRAARAAGSESLRRAYDLALTVDSRWAGGASGGYYPIRIRLTNTAGPRELTIRFTDSNSGASRQPSVERRIQIDQNATTQLTFSIPLVGLNSGGELQFFERGRMLNDLSQHVNLPDATLGAADRPSLLVVHPAPPTIDCTRFEDAVQAIAGGNTAGPGVRYRFSGMAFSSGGVRTNDYQVIAPAMLPESWIDYSALDIVAIPLETLGKVPAAVRAALLAWSDSGGTLVVTEVGEDPSQSRELTRLLDLPDAAGWQAADAKFRLPFHFVTPEMMAGGMMATGAGEPVDAAARLDEANRSMWGTSPEAFSRLDRLAGQVYAFRGNPFPGAPVDWSWWLATSQNARKPLNWTTRNGVASRQHHPEFYNFLIPGVSGVPITAFIVLISLFAVVIGPVNYFFAWRRKQLYLLVLTIPAIALLTSASLFGYSMIAEGFSTRSRLRSVTLLDQRTRQAVSFSRISLYAGLAPSSGMQFSPETAVLPIWESDEGLTSGLVDWTDTQHLAAGWLHSRASTQFETIAHRALRGRVEFASRGAGEAPEAANGLEWPIETVMVRDAAGRLWAGESLPAGGSVLLHAAGPDDFRRLSRALDADKLEAPPGFTANDWTPFSPRSRMMMTYPWQGGGTQAAFSQSILEQGLRRVRDVKEGEAAPAAASGEPDDPGLPRRTYLATFRDNPGIELGVETTRPALGVHVLWGIY